jgi:hypothetical protein
MAGWTDTVFNWLPKFRKPDQSLGEAQCDDAGNLKVTVVDAASAVITTWIDPAPGDEVGSTPAAWANTPRKLHQVVVSNFGTETTFMLFNSAAAVANGGSPVFAWNMPAGATVSFELTRARSFSAGIWWAASTTDDVLTIDGAALLRVNLEVE